LKVGGVQREEKKGKNMFSEGRLEGSKCNLTISECHVASFQAPFTTLE
jgi:hypothetical protein